MKRIIGFNMKVWRHHLDYVAQSLSDGLQDELAENVLDYMTDEIVGQRSRRKTRTILLKIWVNVEEEHKVLRNEALLLYSRLRDDERIALHWGLTVLAYPFFKSVVYELGRLFRLQDVVHSQQILRKMHELYGDRHSVGVSTTAVLSTLRQWNIIRTTNRYENERSDCIAIQTPALKRWLAETVIRSSEKEVLNIEMLNQHPAFFPFDVSISLNQLDRDVFTVTRLGFDNALVGMN